MILLFLYIVTDICYSTAPAGAISEKVLLFASHEETTVKEAILPVVNVVGANEANHRQHVLRLVLADPMQVPVVLEIGTVARVAKIEGQNVETRLP